MPLVIHPRVRKSIRRVAAMTCFAVFASSGAAFASCQTQPTSTPFTQWGDNNSYFLIPGGSFEGTPSQVGWNLSNASLTAGNEPFYVNNSSDSQSLTINAGGSGTSPWFCVDNTMPSFRFFAHEVSPGSDLLVQGVVRTWSGTQTFTVADISDGTMSSWGPVAPISVNTASIPNGVSLPVEARFVVPGNTGSWQVDDVYIDPYRAG
jgi:hypothetical protein